MFAPCGDTREFNRNDAPSRGSRENEKGGKSGRVRARKTTKESDGACVHVRVWKEDGGGEGGRASKQESEKERGQR